MPDTQDPPIGSTYTSAIYKYFIGECIVEYSFLSYWTKLNINAHIKCRSSTKVSFSETVGIEKESIETFTTTLGSSLGPAGLATLKSELKGSISEHLKMSQSKTVTQEFTLPGVECGSVIYDFYRLDHIHNFKLTEPSRFMGILPPKVVAVTLNEPTRIIRLQDRLEPADPECPCPSKDSPNIWRTVSFSVGRLTAKLEAAVKEGRQLLIGEGDQALHVVHSNERGYLIRSEVKSLPDFIRFFALEAGMKPDHVVIIPCNVQALGKESFEGEDIAIGFAEAAFEPELPPRSEVADGEFEA